MSRVFIIGSCVFFALSFVSSVHASVCSKVASGFDWGIQEDFTKAIGDLSSLMSSESLKQATDKNISFSTKRENQLVISIFGKEAEVLDLKSSIQSIQFASVRHGLSFFKKNYLTVVTRNQIFAFEVVFTSGLGGLVLIDKSDLPSELNDGIYTWEITQIKQNTDDNKNPRDLEALYSYTISSGVEVRSSNVTFSQLAPLLNSIGPSEMPHSLEGYRFKSPSRLGVNAFHLLLTQLRPDYKTPSFNELYERTLQAFIRLEQPNFVGVDDEIVFQAFSKAFSSEEWIETMRRSVSQETGGDVILMQDEQGPFSIYSSVPKRFFKLIHNDGVEVSFTFGHPYSRPFSFGPLR